MALEGKLVAVTGASGFVAGEVIKQLLEKGYTDDPMKLYINFRGAEPKIDGLLRKRGLKK